MKNNLWWTGSLIVMALATSAQGKPAVKSVRNVPSLETPTNNILMLSNVSAEVEVLDSKGLVLATNFVFLPRIQFSDLSKAELQALLETKNAYAALTVFESLNRTSVPSEAIKNQLEQIWRKGRSLAEKIQTRLEILEDMRAYNIEIAILPGWVAADSQYAIHSSAADARAEALEDEGGHRRLRRAVDRAITADTQTAEANQQVAEYLAQCAALSSRLASHGIKVPGEPPFYPIPSLSVRVGVDAERMAAHRLGGKGQNRKGGIDPLKQP